MQVPVHDGLQEVSELTASEAGPDQSDRHVEAERAFLLAIIPVVGGSNGVVETKVLQGNNNIISNSWHSLQSLNRPKLTVKKGPKLGPTLCTKTKQISQKRAYSEGLRLTENEPFREALKGPMRGLEIGR